MRIDREEDGRIAIRCSASGIDNIHDFSPFASGQIEGAAQIYVQGFGMEGPSGTFPVDAEPHTSHGLTALFGEEDSRILESVADKIPCDQSIRPEADRTPSGQSTGSAADKTPNTLLLYAEDHTRYSTSFDIEQQKSLTGNTPILSATVNFEGTAGGTWEAPALYLEEATGREAALRHCAKRIAKTMHARNCMPPAFFWPSWYYAYETMDQAMLEEILVGIANERTPFRYLELDAGYSPNLGDWLIPNPRWPEGLAGAAGMIRRAGLLPGIWVAPFIVGDRSQLFRNHPDWIVRDLKDDPVIRLRSYTEPKIWGNPDCNYYVLDASHPEALDYIREVFETLHRWGFAMFKTDFMLWNMYDSACVRRYDPTKTSVEILRNLLGVIREAIGESSYLLGCIAPFMPFIGFADGMRLAGDCGAQWAETFGPVNMIREIPCDNYFNHVFWQNDPDAILLRDFDTMLDSDEVWSLALLQSLSGGAVSTSDPLHLLGDDRKRLLRLVEPHGPVTPQFPRFGKGGKELILTHRLEQGNLLFVMNPTKEPLTVVCRLSELFGEECSWYSFRLHRNGEGETSGEDIFAETIAPHHSVLLFVSAEPLTSTPQNLWNW